MALNIHCVGNAVRLDDLYEFCKRVKLITVNEASLHGYEMKHAPAIPGFPKLSIGALLDRLGNTIDKRLLVDSS